jgi:hypothetical protein
VCGEELASTGGEGVDFPATSRGDPAGRHGTGRSTGSASYDEDGGSYPNYTATFTYDAAGHPLDIKAGTWDDLFDCSCWSD